MVRASNSNHTQLFPAIPWKSCGQPAAAATRPRLSGWKWMESILIQSASVPVVESSSGQDDWVVVGPFGGVTPGPLQGIPEVAPGRVSHDPLGEAPPYQEGKVHLHVQASSDYVFRIRKHLLPKLLLLFQRIYSMCILCNIFLNACSSALLINNPWIHTSLVSRTVSSSKLSTASVSMATWGRNRLVV